MRLALAPLALLLLASPAWAHPARTSAVLLDVGDERIDAELHVPVDQLATALEVAPVDLALPAQDGALRAYLAGHVAVRGDGGAYRVTTGALAIAPIDGAPHLVAHQVWTPPAGARVGRIELDYHVVLHRVKSHRILVFVRSDFAAAVFPTAPRLVDTLRFQRTSLALDRGGASWLNGMMATARLGAHHIGEGTDHLMFLLLLVLSSVWVASGGRWRAPAAAGRALREVIAVVTGFTLGHSVSLVAGVVLGSALPSRPVEIAIAASILLSAVHTLRPLFPGRERLVAAGFGLVHGLAFSTALTALGFRGGALAWSLVGFNLGIELMQLAVVAVALPCLLCWRRHGAYPVIRIAGGVVGVVAASAWLVERAAGVAVPGTGVLAAAVTAVAIAGGRWWWSARRLQRRPAEAAAGRADHAEAAADRAGDQRRLGAEIEGDAELARRVGHRVHAGRRGEPAHAGDGPVQLAEPIAQVRAPVVGPARVAHAGGGSILAGRRARRQG